MQDLLITKEIVADHLQVAIGAEEKEFNNFIREAQDFDLKMLIRPEFFSDLIANKDDPEYMVLLRGGSYTHELKPYHFRGLEAVLSYFTYARYFLSSPHVATSHGIVYKKNPNSEPVPLEERRNVYYKKREEANILLQDAFTYIGRNSLTFPSFTSGQNCGTSEEIGRINSYVIK